jgi:hypothetical protein
VLNGVGSSIWRDIAYGRSLASIIEKLSEEYRSNKETIALDVTLFVQEALNKDILVQADGEEE